jgi:hypothetical protein
LYKGSKLLSLGELCFFVASLHASAVLTYCLWQSLCQKWLLLMASACTAALQKRLLLMASACTAALQHTHWRPVSMQLEAAL